MGIYERQVKKKYEADGWKVYHSGLPDFLCVKDGQLLFVEAKSSVDKVRPNQQQAIDALRVCGVNVVVDQEAPESQRSIFLELHTDGKVRLARGLGHIVRAQRQDNTFRATIPQEAAVRLGLENGGEYVQFFESPGKPGLLFVKKVKGF